MRGSAHYRRHAASGQPASRRVLVAGPIVTIDITHTGSQVSILGPYLPRLVIDWIADDADRSYQEIEGSVTFVDVSGFTNLSERLAKRGKVGAEDLADSIGSCFTDLLAVAYGEGGGLLKFGGDALLLLFTGAWSRSKGVPRRGPRCARSSGLQAASTSRARRCSSACPPVCTPGCSTSSSSARRTRNSSSRAQPRAGP